MAKSSWTKKSGIERRRHKRFALLCPARISVNGAEEVLGKTVNVSDGGLYVVVPASSPLPACRQNLDVTFSLPRATPNTYMLEEVHSTAKVLRRQARKGKRQACVALQFVQPLDLAVEV
jgi:hypothetical protein